MDGTAEIDFIANGLVSGQLSCEGCGDLGKLVEDVKDGRMSIEEFKKILSDVKSNQVKQIV